MIHQPSGGAQGQATEIEIVAEQILRTKEKLNRILAENTGQPYEKIVQDTERDNYMTAEQAKAYGIIDAVVEKRQQYVLSESQCISFYGGFQKILRTHQIIGLPQLLQLW